jgi:AAA+ ATPase superfamily predicted ATPase
VKIIGRKQEQAQLKKYMESEKPEFVAVYGRRRVGKTFLVKEALGAYFAFHLTGVSKKEKVVQLDYFARAMRAYGCTLSEVPKSWPDAFDQLKNLLAQNGTGQKQVVFFDEISWLDTHRSGFLSALEHFWNDWASSRPDILLIACGSSTSWIVDNLLENKDGLFNRITRRMELLPFTLAECEEYYIDNFIAYDRRQMAEAYMIFGGIPFYLSLMESGMSIAQNTDDLCFARNAQLKNEFAELYATVFKHPDRHIEIVKALASKRGGHSRDDIIDKTGIPSGGGLTKALDELDASGFIYRYNDFTGAGDRYLYQLVDPFTLFYLAFMDTRGKRRENLKFWSQYTGSGGYYNWAGYAFERLCLLHTDGIKRALGISGIMTNIYSWRSAQSKPAAQIDLVIDRSDGVVDLCEMKFVSDAYSLRADEAEKLRARITAFRRETKTKRAVHLVMVSTYGMVYGKHSGDVQAQVTLDDLFATT